MRHPFKAPLTGPKFFAIFGCFFLVIISVNATLAYSALRTFPGIEVKNAYIASQTFDDDRAAQEALGWQTAARVEGNQLLLSIHDITSGAPIEVERIDAIFGRATNASQDQFPEFVFDGALYRATIIPATGYWPLRLKIRAPDGTLFQQRLQIVIE